MDIFRTITQIAESTFNEELRKSKENGAKIMGYFCAYVPEEVIHAAGFIPYRMRVAQSMGTSKGDAFYSPLNCTFVRHLFDKVMREEFSFLDGVIFMNGCDHTRRMYDNWRFAGLPPDFKHLFIVPHVCGANAFGEYRQNIEILIKDMEKAFSLSVSQEKLISSIRLYNKKRDILERISASRKNEHVPISGKQMLETVLAVTAIPVERAIEILEELEKAIQGRQVNQEDDLRILVSGGCLEEPEHMELIESQGGVVVADSICLGARYTGTRVDPEDSPLDGLAKAYLFHLSCPRMMDDSHNRVSYLQKTAKEYRVDAMIMEKLKFCDLWGWEIFRTRQEAKKMGLPFLPIERELKGGGTGQMKTRIQAFYEKVKNRMAVDDQIIHAAGDDYRMVKHE